MPISQHILPDSSVSGDVIGMGTNFALRLSRIPFYFLKPPPIFQDDLCLFFAPDEYRNTETGALFCSHHFRQLVYAHLEACGKSVLQ
jgi:hypothetical protein